MNAVVPGKRGPPKGTRPSGREKGTPNKATVDRALAARIDAMKASVAGLRGKDTLQRLMAVAETIAFKHQPPESAVIEERQRDENRRAAAEGREPVTIYAGSQELFGAWFDRAAYCARELAKYQDPTFKAIAVVAPTEQAPASAAPVIEHEPTDEEGRERYANAAYLRLVKG